MAEIISSYIKKLLSEKALTSLLFLIKKIISSFSRSNMEKIYEKLEKCSTTDELKNILRKIKLVDRRGIKLSKRGIEFYRKIEKEFN